MKLLLSLPKILVDRRSSLYKPLPLSNMTIFVCIVIYHNDDGYLPLLNRLLVVTHFSIVTICSLYTLVM
jgi:hypothetical protein